MLYMVFTTILHFQNLKTFKFQNTLGPQQLQIKDYGPIVSKSHLCINSLLFCLIYDFTLYLL